MNLQNPVCSGGRAGVGGAGEAKILEEEIKSFFFLILGRRAKTVGEKDDDEA